MQIVTWKCAISFFKRKKVNKLEMWSKNEQYSIASTSTMHLKMCNGYKHALNTCTFRQSYNAAHFLMFITMRQNWIDTIDLHCLCAQKYSMQFSKTAVQNEIWSLILKTSRKSRDTEKIKVVIQRNWSVLMGFVWYLKCKYMYAINLIFPNHRKGWLSLKCTKCRMKSDSGVKLTGQKWMYM